MYIGNKKVSFGTPSKPVYPDFAGNLARLRKDHCMTQAELATMLGVSSDSVYKWEKGTVMPRYAVLSTLSLAFGTPISELLGRISDQHYPKGTVKRKWVIEGDDLTEK